MGAKNDIHGAILSLNKARRQEYYGPIAAEAMFDICLRVAYDHAIPLSGRPRSAENVLAAQGLCQQLYGELTMLTTRHRISTDNIHFLDPLPYATMAQCHQIR